MRRMDLRLPKLLAEDSSPRRVPLRRDTQGGSAKTNPMTFSTVFLFMLAMVCAPPASEPTQFSYNEPPR